MSITAMKQALEALEYRARGPVSGEKDLTDRAITALRTAIEQAEKQEPVLWQWKDSEMVSPFDKTNVEGWTPLYTTPSAAQPAPVQEPVAWCVLEPWLSGKFEAQDCFSDVALDANVGWVPLYTTPPAAQRQPLTEEEIVQVLGNVRESVSGGVFLAFARAIEAKLKEKNT